jgi:hypothetical protein
VPKPEADGVITRMGNKLAEFLSKPLPGYHRFSPLSEAQLQAHLQPADLILVEGNSRVSTAIKYLTQSTWSHVCLYIGDQYGSQQSDKVLQPILEADLVEGVITAPLNKYDGFNLRICRPINLSEQDRRALIEFAIARIGHQYDKKNIFDLMRYLLPTPPVPQRFRRNLLEFGSGDPTKAICSTLVAQAFHAISYPILPLEIEDNESKRDAHKPRGKRLTKRHFSHFTPRDFDLSPYFEIIKPTVQSGFNYKSINWSEPQKD